MHTGRGDTVDHRRRRGRGRGGGGDEGINSLCILFYCNTP